MVKDWHDVYGIEKVMNENVKMHRASNSIEGYTPLSPNICDFLYQL
jgi:hypothetical protein